MCLVPSGVEFVPEPDLNREIVPHPHGVLHVPGAHQSSPAQLCRIGDNLKGSAGAAMSPCRKVVKLVKLACPTGAKRCPHYPEAAETRRPG